MFSRDPEFRRVLHHSVLNLLGNAAPLLTAAVALPVLVRGLGQGGFGLFSLMWVVLGYFSIFDLGLSRALTRLIAECLATGRRAEIPDLVTTVLWLLAGLGLLGGLLCAGAALLRLNLGPLPEGLRASDGPWIAGVLLAGVPATLIVAGIRGILEGYQDFRRANALRVPAGIALMGLPALAVLIDARLVVALAGLLAARILILVLHVQMARGHLADLRGTFRAERIGLLLRFGGWLTVSNVVGPLIVYVDRFVLAGWLNAAAVGFYTAPFEIVARLLILPQALSNALFPKLTAVQATDEVQFRRLYRKGLLACLGIVCPVAAIAWLSAPWVLEHWLGAAFSEHSAGAMRVLLIGFIFNALAQLPLTALHSQGRARPVALLHLCELPVYLLILIALVQALGLTGAAWAWTLRSLADCGALLWLVRPRLMPSPLADPAIAASNSERRP